MCTLSTSRDEVEMELEEENEEDMPRW